tara:strand:- start:17618 stop:18934 length:1317 start_codon:yes stop_codon:yes gene_type:complete
MTVKTIANLKVDVTADLPDNTAGDIGASDVRESVIDTIDSLYNCIPSNVVIVKEASDLSGTLSDSVSYIIDGMIDMGSTQIKVPVGGLNIDGQNFDNSQLFSSADNYTMFVKEDAAAYAGYLRCASVSFNVTGTDSKLLDLDNAENFNSAEFEFCNFGSFASSMTSIGVVSNYRTLRFDGCGFIGLLDGVEFGGNMAGGIVVTDSIALSLPAMTFLKEGTSLVVSGDSRNEMNFNSVDAAAVCCDFQPSNITNDGSFVFNNFRTTATNAVPNLPVTSTKNVRTSCQGIENTYAGGQWDLTVAATTTIAAVDTAVKLAGTTVYSDLVFFSNITDNSFVCDSDKGIEYAINGSVVLDGNAGDFLKLIVRHWDDSTSSYVDLRSFSREVVNGTGGSDFASISYRANALLDVNDRIELWVENNSGTSNVTAQVGSYMNIDER